MSLVSEALRKARQHSEGERSPGGSVPPSLVLPPRRHRATPAVIPLILAALGAGVVGGVIVWWMLGARQPAPRNDTAGAVPDTATQVMPHPSEAPEREASATSAAGAIDPVAAPTSPANVAPTAAATPSPTAEVVAEPATSAPHRTRDVLIDADLGYAKLHLDYLVYRRGSPFGRVNGRDIVIGSIVDGFTVEEITADYIKLSDRRNTVFLRVR